MPRRSSRCDRIYDYILSYYEQHGISPSYREIMTDAELASVSSVSYHLRRLVAEGKLRQVNKPHSSRNYVPQS